MRTIHRKQEAKQNYFASTMPAITKSSELTHVNMIADWFTLAYVVAM